MVAILLGLEGGEKAGEKRVETGAKPGRKRVESGEEAVWKGENRGGRAEVEWAKGRLGESVKKVRGEGAGVAGWVSGRLASAGVPRCGEQGARHLIPRFWFLVLYVF